MMIGIGRVSVPSPRRPAFAICFPSSRRKIEEKSERVTNRLIDFTVGAQHLQDPLKRPQKKFQPIICATAAATAAVVAFHSF